MNFETKNLDKATYQIKATIPFAKVKETYEHVLHEVAKNAEIKGFRKGMAPVSEVERSLDKGKLYGEVINHLAPEVYTQAIKETHLKPIINPRIRIVEFDFEGKKDLVLELVTCVRPEVKLGEYARRETLETGRQAKTTGKPDPSQPSEPSQPSTDEKQTLALKALLDSSEVEVPQLLIDEEVERSLSRLVDQTERLGLTIDKYLKATGKNPESIKAEYAQKAREALKQEFVILEVAEKENIKAKEEEVESMIKAAGDEKVRAELSKPEHRPYLESVIIKRKVVEAISSQPSL